MRRQRPCSWQRRAWAGRWRRLGLYDEDGRERGRCCRVRDGVKACRANLVAFLRVEVGVRIEIGVPGRYR